MGIESDQLVFDYLSRVGDVAQQRQLTSQDRMRLVASLRDEIGRRRAKDGADSPAAVRRIIDSLGTPDEVVTSASGPGTPGSGVSYADPGPGPRGTGVSYGAGAPDPGASPPGTGAPSPAPRTGGPEAGAGSRSGVPEQRTPRTRRLVPRPRRKEPEPPPRPAGSWGPHLAGMDEIGVSDDRPDWWRVEEGPFGADDLVPGFRGGVEIPDMLAPPGKTEAEKDGKAGAGGKDAGGEEAGKGDGAPRRRLPRLRRRPRQAPGKEAAPAPEPAPATARIGSPLLLVAAALLVAGAVLGSWLALAGGWLLAYASRRLSRAEAKWAVLGLPGLVAAGAAVWLWGRVDGRWGEPIAAGGEAMGAALTGMWPWVVRGAAVASALYLAWRARRT